MGTLTIQKAAHRLEREVVEPIQIKREGSKQMTLGDKELKDRPWQWKDSLTLSNFWF